MRCIRKLVLKVANGLDCLLIKKLPEKPAMRKWATKRLVKRSEKQLACSSNIDELRDRIQTLARALNSVMHNCNITSVDLVDDNGNVERVVFINEIGLLSILRKSEVFDKPKQTLEFMSAPAYNQFYH